MSPREGSRSLGRRLGPVGLVWAVLVAAAAVPSGAVAQTPDQVINAQTDPAAASAALNKACGDNINNCALAPTTDPDRLSLSYGWGPPQILGDILYNCAPLNGPNASTATGVSDTRGESTSVSESVSLTLQGGLIGIASASTEFKVTSSQSESVSTGVSTNTAIPVPPGFKGYTTTQVPSINATASYYVTDGINLIKVQGIDLSFPGYGDPNSNGNDGQVAYNMITKPIDPAFVIDLANPLSYLGLAPCTAVNDNPTTTAVGSSLGAVRQKVANGSVTTVVGSLGAVRPNVPKGSFTFTLCSSGKRCVNHRIRAAPPAKVRRATVSLRRGGRSYATGTNIRGRIRLTERRRITVGRYRLTIKQKPKKFIERRHGGRLAMRRVSTVIPLNVCGNSVSSSRLRFAPSRLSFGSSCRDAKR